MMLTNPFYHNYVFSKKDLDRPLVNRWVYPAIWFRPTYAQVSDGYMFAYTTDWSGQYYLLKVEKECCRNFEISA